MSPPVCVTVSTMTALRVCDCGNAPEAEVTLPREQTEVVEPVSVSLMTEAHSHSGTNPRPEQISYNTQPEYYSHVLIPQDEMKEMQHLGVLFCKFCYFIPGNIVGF